VVTYTVDNQSVYEEALRLFSQRPKGTPLYLPARTPPVLGSMKLSWPHGCIA
jgi:hypothetical protein